MKENYDLDNISYYEKWLTYRITKTIMVLDDRKENAYEQNGASKIRCY